MYLCRSPNSNGAGIPQWWRPCTPTKVEARIFRLWPILYQSCTRKLFKAQSCMQLYQEKISFEIKLKSKRGLSRQLFAVFSFTLKNSIIVQELSILSVLELLKSAMPFSFNNNQQMIREDFTEIKFTLYCAFPQSYSFFCVMFTVITFW